MLPSAWSLSGDNCSKHRRAFESTQAFVMADLTDLGLTGAALKIRNPRPLQIIIGCLF